MPIITHIIQFTEDGGVVVPPFSDNVTPNEAQLEALLGVFSAAANGDYDLFHPDRDEQFLAYLNDAEALRTRLGLNPDEADEEFVGDPVHQSDYLVRLRSDSPYAQSEDA